MRAHHFLKTESRLCIQPRIPFSRNVKNPPKIIPCLTVFKYRKLGTIKVRMKCTFIFLVFYIIAIETTQAAPISVLPYAKRTQGYAGYSSTVRGEIRSIGMSGATIGLADSVIAAADNPGGFAMAMDSIALQAAGNRIQDAHVQTYNEALTSNSFGVYADSYPWGFGFSIWTPQNEGQTYLAPSGDPVTPQVSTKEYRLSAARLLGNDHQFSLGVTLTLGQATEELHYAQTTLDESQSEWGLGATVGGMMKLPQHWLLGASFSMPINYEINSARQSSTGITNFFQPIKSPARMGVGLGWIPNRFFHLGTSLHWTGATPDVALLRDNSIRVGNESTLQPRIGAMYIAVDIPEFKVEVTGGTYLEVSRIDGTPNRGHFTSGIEFNIWLVNLGWGIDHATNYNNFIFAGGIDVVRLARKLEFIPRGNPPPQGGWFPNPIHLSHAGKPRAINPEWKFTKDDDVIEVTKQLPYRIEEKMRKTGTQIQGLGADFINLFESKEKPAVPEEKSEISGPSNSDPS